MTEIPNLPDLARQCGWCGDEDRPESMEVWRDADGEGWWRHRWCSIPVPSTWSKPVTEIPNLLDGTEQFLTASGHPIPDVPTIPPASVIALRMRLLIEEVSERAEAIGFRDLYDYLACESNRDTEDVIQAAIDGTGRYPFNLPEMIDADHDICVIAHGGALEAAGRAGAAATAAEVTRSNLDKVNGKHGPTVWAGEPMNSKVKKPAGWVGPDIAGVLKAAGWEAT